MNLSSIRERNSNNMIKLKKTSIAISLINFILSLGVVFGYFSVLYFETHYAYTVDAFIQSFNLFLGAFDYTSGSQDLLMLAVFAPLALSILGLFGRLGRFVNILSFGGFFFSLCYFALIRIFAGEKLFPAFDLGPGYIWISIMLIILILGTFFSLINVEKSK